MPLSGMMRGGGREACEGHDVQGGVGIHAAMGWDKACRTDVELSMSGLLGYRRSRDP